MSSKEFVNALSGRRELTITVRGRKTGKEHSIPVSFVLEGKTIHLLPVKGSSSSWYRNILRNRGMKISVGDRFLEVQAAPTDEPGDVSETVRLFEEKYGSDHLAKWYSLRDVCVRIHLS